MANEGIRTKSLLKFTIFSVSADEVEIEGPDYAELGKSVNLTCKVRGVINSEIDFPTTRS